MIIDTHSHLNFKAFDGDANEVIQKSVAGGVWMVNVGSKYETSKRAVELAEQYAEGVYATIGLHPIYAAADLVKTKTDPDEGEFLIKEQDFDREKYLALGQSKKVVAIGEIGLDYYYKPKSTAKLAAFKEKQKEVFVAQLGLARELGLPLMLHCRMAHDDVIEILRSRGEDRGVIHCFTGTLEQARRYIDLGFLIGINGIIFKLDLAEVVREIGLEHMVLETDCPYLTPVPEGDKRNEPLFIQHTANKVAELKGVPVEEVIQKTTENARKLFGI